MALNYIRKEPIYAEIIFRETIVNTSNFSANDLDIFIDSMETIARVQRERKERRLRRRNLKLNAPNSNANDDVRSIPLPPADDSSEAEEDSKAIYPNQSHNKLSTEGEDDASPGHSSDENYFSGASRSESPTDGGGSGTSKESIDGSPPPSVDSGTESESGVYKLRPRSYAMTSPKYRTTRARIIGLVLKREYADGGSKDELEKQERRERLLEGLLREKDKCESLRLTTKECTRKPILGSKTAVDKQSTTAEMRFIDKALRYLTL